MAKILYGYLSYFLIFFRRVDVGLHGAGAQGCWKSCSKTGRNATNSRHSGRPTARSDAAAEGCRATSRSNRSAMPEGVRLPLDSEDEFHSLEDRLNCDEAYFTALVSLKHFIRLFLIRQNHCMDLLLALPAQALRFCRSYVQLLFMSSNVEQRPLRWHMNSKNLPTFFLKIQIK